MNQASRRAPGTILPVVLIVIFVLWFPACCAAQELPDLEAARGSRIDSMCALSSEAFAGGDFTFIRKAARELLSGVPRAVGVRVLDAEGHVVFTEGSASPPPDGFVTGSARRVATNQGTWLKSDVRFGERVVNRVVAHFPPASTPKAPASVSTSASEPATQAFPVGWTAVGGAAAVGVLVALLALCRSARRKNSALDARLERDALRRSAGLDPVRDLFQNLPLSGDGKFRLRDQGRCESLRQALEPAESCLLTAVREGRPLSLLVASESVEGAMELHAALRRLLGAGLIEPL